MPDTSSLPHDKQVQPSRINRQALKRVKPTHPLQVAHPGDRCRTLFPEFLLACVPSAGLLSLGERVAVGANLAPTIGTWLGTLISDELSRRLETPWRRLPVVGAPLIPGDQSGPSALALRELFLQFDSWSPEQVPGAAEVADLLAALTALVDHMNEAA
jgi:hypothetical protein